MLLVNVNFSGLLCVCVCICVLQHAAVALSALIQALDSLKMVAIVRYIYDRRCNPQVGAAFPCVKDKYEVCGSESYRNTPHAMCVTLESLSFLPLLPSAWCMCSYRTWRTSVSSLSLHWRTTRNLFHQVRSHGIRLICRKLDHLCFSFFFFLFLLFFFFKEMWKFKKNLIATFSKIVEILFSPQKNQLL